MTDTPAPASLAERARAAARTRTDSDDPDWPGLPWLHHARWIARRLARTLGIPTEYVAVQASPLRRRGGWPWPELTVTDHGATFRFVAVYCDPDQIIALGPCPVCEAEVPTFPISTLADLGDLLDSEHHHGPVLIMHKDPGHTPACPHAAPTPIA
jgi:hypothetical protein